MARVLVVDDEPDLAEIAALVLEWAGHQTACWVPTEPVMQAVRRFRPDVVVLDWVLGGPSGDQVLEELRADPALAGVKVVVMSALHGLQAGALLLGAVRFVGKPFEPQELVRAVDGALHQPRELNP